MAHLRALMILGSLALCSSAAAEPQNNSQLGIDQSKVEEALRLGPGHTVTILPQGGLGKLPRSKRIQLKQIVNAEKGSTGQDELAPDTVVAIVNDQSITLAEVDAALKVSPNAVGSLINQQAAQKRALRKLTLNELVDDHLLIQAMAARGYLPTDAEISAYLQKRMAAGGLFPTLATEPAMPLPNDMLRHKARSALCKQHYLHDVVLPRIKIDMAQIEKRYKEYTLKAQQTGSKTPPLKDVQDSISTTLKQEALATGLSQDLKKLRTSGKVQVLF